MYARRINYKHHRWNYMVRCGRYCCSSIYRDYPAGQRLGPAPRTSSLIENYTTNFSILLDLAYGSHCTRSQQSLDISWRNCQHRFYSSKGDGRNTSEDKQIPNNDVADCDKKNICQSTSTDSARHCDAHARLGEQDQMEWLKNSKLAIESRGESAFLTPRERFKNEFLRRVVPWEKITVSWDTFPYYLHANTKNLLVECVASHLKHKKFTTGYGGRLTSSGGKIMLQGSPGMELYRERLVRALARDLQVPLMVLDGSILSPYDFNETESDEDNAECTSGSEIDDENDMGNEEDYSSSGDEMSSNSDDEVDIRGIHVSAKALRKLIPHDTEEFVKGESGESRSSSDSTKSEAVEPSDKASRPLKKGDRVKYTGPSVCIATDNRSLSNGQRGEVYEVNGDQVAVIFYISGQAQEEGKDDKSAETAAKPLVCWLQVKDIDFDHDAQAHDCYVMMEVLCEVLESRQPLIVYLPDPSRWLSSTVSKTNQKEFVSKVQEMFDQLSASVVLICGQNKAETGSKEKGKFTMILPNLGRIAKLPLSLKSLTEGLKATKRSEVDDITKIFTNVMCIHPPKEEDLLRVFNKQIEDDKKIVISRSNINEIHKVLEEHDLSCVDILHVNTDGMILTKEKAEKVVGWAKNHHLSTCLLPSVKGDRLQLPRESLELAISRLKEQDATSKKSPQNLKNLAEDEYETNFVSAVVPPGEVGVKFDDIGALEDVKKALNELVILPMRRPELFSRGNLLQPCKGILLFGPPGTGKTLLAKALATEAGANFISITGSTLTSKWFGDAEKLTKALFSFASKLAPVIVFVDEVDSLLGARGGGHEHEATRRMRNEFMAAWDGLRSKDSQRILILGATNRPFDLDDAVIRRLPRRIYVDLPDAKNRLKILKIILAQENLEPEFPFEQLANATEGYSGSDLKNLCVAAAYRPVQELLEEESKVGKHDGSPVLRPLTLEDFTNSKGKVGPSVAYNAVTMNELRNWNEQYGEGGSRRRSPFGF